MADQKFELAGFLERVEGVTVPGVGGVPIAIRPPVLTRMIYRAALPAARWFIRHTPVDKGDLLQSIKEYVRGGVYTIGYFGEPAEKLENVERRHRTFAGMEGRREGILRRFDSIVARYVRVTTRAYEDDPEAVVRGPGAPRDLFVTAPARRERFADLKEAQLRRALAGESSAVRTDPVQLRAKLDVIEERKRSRRTRKRLTSATARAAGRSARRPRRGRSVIQRILSVAALASLFREPDPEEDEDGG